MKIPKWQKIARHLSHEIDGTVQTDEKTLELCSMDKSIYQIRPQCVVTPSSFEDLVKVVHCARNDNIPLTMRGGGSGTAGAALGSGIVVRFKRDGFFSSMKNFESNGTSAYVDVGAGVYHEDLQNFLKPQGFYLPADPSSGPICQIGGNIATKASGPHGFSHGAIDRFLENIEYIDATGNLTSTQNTSTVPFAIINELSKLQKNVASNRVASEILQKRRQMKTASGYNLFALLNSRNPAGFIPQLFAGSIGTLGLITSTRLRLEPYLTEKAALLLYFESLDDLGLATQEAMTFPVTAIEVISRATIRLLQKRKGAGTTQLQDGHLLFIESEGENCIENLLHIKKSLLHKTPPLVVAPELATTPEELARLWKLRKQILPVLLKPHGGKKALSIVNDVGVPPEYLAPFILDIEKFFSSQNLEAVIFGHAGNGNLHLRPLIDTESPHLKNRLKFLADGVYERVFRYHGTITAEHGMGPLRTPYLEQEWGKDIYKYMKELKKIFDPDNIFNPGAMFGPNNITDNLRQDLFPKTYGE